MPELSHRVQTFTDSVIRRMTRISDEVGAINLSQGFPDFPPPKAITDRLREVADEGPHQYSVTFGAENFREALARKMSLAYGRKINPDTEVLVTCGGTEAMMSAMMTVCNPGDKVVVFSPFYENYGADAILSGADPIFVPLVPPTFDFDRQALEDAFRQHPKAIIVCNPSNPCGKVFTKEELLFIGGLCRRYDAYMITDEVYEHIVYAPHVHTYFASLPGMRDRTLSCSSLSKTYSMTGWRLGYVIAPAEVIDRAKKVHDFLTVGAAAPLMEAAVAGLALPDSYYEDMAALYTHKRDLFCSGLRDLGFSIVEPQGAYYVMADVADVERELGYTDDEAFAVDLCRKVGVATVPGNCFFAGDDYHFVRFHFAKSDELLESALDALDGWRDKLAR